MACLRSWFIGLISAWLPSRRSTEHQVGAFVMTLSGHVRSRRPTGGNGRYFSKGIVFVLTGVAMVRGPRFVGSGGWLSRLAEKQRNLPARGRRRFPASRLWGARLLEKEQALVRVTGHRLPTIAEDGGTKDRFRRAARAAGSAVDWPAIGEAVRSHLADWLADRAPTTVLLYHALPDEAPVDGLARRPELGHHRWALTRTGSVGAVDLSLHPLASPQERHRHGYRQPVAGSPLVADVDV